MNVHHKCQMKVANLWYQPEALAEALNQVSQVGRHWEPVQGSWGWDQSRLMLTPGVNCSEGYLYQRPHFWKIHFKVWSLLESGGLVLSKIVIQAVL